MINIADRLRKRKSPQNPESSWDDLERRSAQAKANIETEQKGKATFPDVISRRITSAGLLAVLVAAIATALIIAMKDMTYAFLFLFVLYLAYISISTWVDFRSGKIIELVLVCASVNNHLTSLQVVMEDTNVDPVKFYTFYYPKKNCPFFPGNVYVVYVNKNNPSKIIGQIGV